MRVSRRGRHLQSPIDTVVFLHPLCRSDIDLSPPSPSSITCHGPKGGTVSKQRWVWPSLTHTHTHRALSLPSPHTLKSHSGGYRRGPLRLSRWAGSHRGVWISHSRVIDLFFSALVALVVIDIEPAVQILLLQPKTRSFFWCLTLFFFISRASKTKNVFIISFPVIQGSNVMEDHDLKEIGIADPSHRKKILHAARSLPKVTKLQYSPLLQSPILCACQVFVFEACQALIMSRLKTKRRDKRKKSEIWLKMFITELCFKALFSPPSVISD